MSKQEPNHISQLGYKSKTPQETSMARPEHMPSYRSSKFPSCVTSHTLILNSIPPHPLTNTHPTTHINHPPSLIPIALSILHLTHGLYQAALGGHTGHTALIFRSESHSQVQSWMQSCIQLFTGVKKRS